VEAAGSSDTTPHHMRHISEDSNFRDASYSCDLIVLSSVT